MKTFFLATGLLAASAFAAPVYEPAMSIAQRTEEGVVTWADVIKRSPAEEGVVTWADVIKRFPAEEGVVTWADVSKLFLLPHYEC